jgi:hypothetical protein
MKTLVIFLLFLLMNTCLGMAQNKYEREFRIRKDQFPAVAHDLIQEYIRDAKRLRFYKEVDSAKTSFEAKFKKDRLWYSVEFDEEGNLEDIEILIEPVDVPSDTFAKIEQYLKGKFSKHKITRLQQQYLATPKEPVEKTLKNAFQNLMLPYINYELMVSGKKDKSYVQFEILFDAQGNFLMQRRSLPPNYDHVLY